MSILKLSYLKDSSAERFRNGFISLRAQPRASHELVSEHYQSDGKGGNFFSRKGAILNWSQIRKRSYIRARARSVNDRVAK